MGPIVRGREMVWANSFGEMAKFSKASGRRERRMDTGYGDHLGEITMKAAGKITIKMEKAVSIMQVFLSIEGTFLNPSKMAMVKRISPTEINILEITVKENPTDTVDIFGKMGTAMREISLQGSGRGEVALDWSVGKNMKGIFLVIKNKAMGGKTHREMDTFKEFFQKGSKSQVLIFRKRVISSQF